MADTVDRIVAASKLPLSIVIVGVGGAEFKNMVSARHMIQFRLFFLYTKWFSTIAYNSVYAFVLLNSIDCVIQ